MAVTKIHAVQTAVHKAVSYICNPSKTDEGILISSFGCSPETAAFDFRFALSKTRRSDPNKAFHLIQAFMPGEVSYDEAHRIGVELADRLLEGRHSYIVTTHTDRGHVHNHVIFCAADNVSHAKYRDCKKTYYNIRKLSDELCREHKLSLIEPDGSRGKTYKEWQSGQSGSSWKERLKNDIDESIKAGETYEDCIALIRAKGYEVKGRNQSNRKRLLGENAHKFISFRPLGRERFVRGSAKSLGAEYTKERIKERIGEKALEPPKKRIPFPTGRKAAAKDYSKENLIDTSGDRFVQSPGLKHWADIQNLKIAAANYSRPGSISELEKQIAAKSALAKTARESLVETEHRLKDLGEILKYAEQYKTNHIYHVRYKKSKDKDAYLRRHETELILHDGAENMLKRLCIDTKNLDVEKIRSDYNALYSKKQDLQKTYKAAEKEAADMSRNLDKLNRYLDRSTKQADISNKKSGKSQNTL